MVSNRKALSCVETLIKYCNEQPGCQNCIFRLHGCDHWKCNIAAYDLRDIKDNIEAKRKNHGWI